MKKILFLPIIAFLLNTQVANAQGCGNACCGTVMPDPNEIEVSEVWTFTRFLFKTLV
jgi:hypothetical protein